MKMPAYRDTDNRLRLLKAVADPSRLAILDRLSDCGDRCHCDLEDDLDIPANRMSFHLKVLREAGLVTPVREGRRVRYLLADGAGEALHAALPGRGCRPVVPKVEPIATVPELLGDVSTAT